MVRKSKINTVFMDSHEKSGNLIEPGRKPGKMSGSMCMNPALISRF